MTEAQHVLDRIHEDLRANARGMYTYEAATELLIRSGWTRWQAFQDDVLAVDDHGRWWTDWEALGEILDPDSVRYSGILAASGGELRMLRLAHSMATGDLSDDVPGLDRANVALILAAIAHLGGTHEHSEMVMDPDGTHVQTSSDGSTTRISIKRLGSLFPWPDEA